MSELRAAQDLRFAMLESTISQLSSEVAVWKGRAQELEERLSQKQDKKEKKESIKRTSTPKPAVT